MKGCQKKIILLKGTGSSLFEEAYFIMRDSKEREPSETDMISEARRIIEGNDLIIPRKPEKLPLRTALVCFLFGAESALLFILTLMTL